MKNKLKILELTNFSAGGCGVFARVKREASLLKRAGYKVKIFSSNLEKGTNKIMPEKDSFDGVNIIRFPAISLGGESFTRWNFTKQAVEYHPDIIIAHAYRHYHTLLAIKIAKKINAKVFLVTHAPFDRDESRALLARVAVRFFDKFIGPAVLKKYNKVIAITKWEMPYLYKLGVKKDKISYIPNGILDEFFLKDKVKEERKMIYTGRVSPIKDIKTLVKSVPLLSDKDITLEVYGPAENSYLKELKELTSSIKKRVTFIDKIYDSKSQIKEIDSSKLFILPSLSEGMPQVLIEAMARGKIVIASNNQGNSDIIKNAENGLLFKIGNPADLAKKIDFALSLSKIDSAKISQNARKTAEKFK